MSRKFNSEKSPIRSIRRKSRIWKFNHEKFLPLESKNAYRVAFESSHKKARAKTTPTAIISREAIGKIIPLAIENVVPQTSRIKHDENYFVQELLVASIKNSTPSTQAFHASVS